MEIELPSLGFREVSLRASEPATRGRRATPLDIDRMITIGGPEVVRIGLDEVGAEDDIRPFVAARAADYSFHLLHMACTVVPEGEFPLRQVSLDFTLAGLDPQAEPAPIALSMAPERLDQPVEMSRSITLGAKLNIIDAAVERAQTTTIQAVYVQAMNQLRPDPKWQLYRTASTAIKGMQRFAMVVQTPRVGGVGSVMVRAKVEHRTLAVFRGAASYEAQSPVPFALPG